MANSNQQDSKGLLGWIDARFPLSSTLKAHVTEYYAPKNFNFWYFFGALATLVLVIQILTGIFLTMNYKPEASLAFASVEYIIISLEGVGYIPSDNPNFKPTGQEIGSIPSFLKSKG